MAGFIPETGAGFVLLIKSPNGKAVIVVPILVDS